MFSASGLESYYGFLRQSYNAAVIQERLYVHEHKLVQPLSESRRCRATGQRYFNFVISSFGFHEI